MMKMKPKVQFESQNVNTCIDIEHSRTIHSMINDECHQLSTRKPTGDENRPRVLLL